MGILAHSFLNISKTKDPAILIGPAHTDSQRVRELLVHRMDPTQKVQLQMGWHFGCLWGNNLSSMMIR